MLAFDNNTSIFSCMERRTVYKKTTRYVVFFLSILGGLGLARLGGEPSGWWSIVLGILAIASFRRARLISVYFLVYAE